MIRMHPTLPALIAETSATLLDFYTLYMHPSLLLLLATRVNLGRKLKLPPSLKTIHLLAVLLASGYAVVIILWQIRTPACSSLWIDRQVTGMSQKESGARGPPLDPPVSARLQRAANHMRSYFSTYTVSEDR